jgi:hypothetical protein
MTGKNQAVIFRRAVTIFCALSRFARLWYVALHKKSLNLPPSHQGTKKIKSDKGLTLVSWCLGGYNFVSDSPWT